MRTVTIGVDLAKQVLSVCSVDAAGRVQERRICAVMPSFSGCPAFRPARPWQWRPAAAPMTTDE